MYLKCVAILVNAYVYVCVLLCTYYVCVYTVQDMSAEKFESSPIIFGDYIKVGADASDRLYEELVDMKKVENVLNEVKREEGRRREGGREGGEKEGGRRREGGREEERRREGGGEKEGGRSIVHTYTHTYVRKSAYDR